MNSPKIPLRFATMLAVSLLFAGAAYADHHTVKVATKEKVGSYLTDAKGMTLYVFKKDSPGKSACVADCVTKWPLYYREKVGAMILPPGRSTSRRHESARGRSGTR